VIAPFRAAAVQFEPRQFAKAANIASFASLVEQSTHQYKALFAQ
jgi:predicted amidohydrolase